MKTKANILPQLSGAVCFRNEAGKSYLCCRMETLSKVSSSTERRLGESVVLHPMECLTPTPKFDIFKTISHLFVCQPTLEFTTFEQQVCSITQMHYHWEQTAAKSETW